MWRIKVWVRAFFGFSRVETNAFLILLPLMMFILLSEPAYRWWTIRQPVNLSGDKAFLDSLMGAMKLLEKDSLVAKAIATDIHFKEFDPNLISEAQLIAYGLRPSMANRIIRYRSKGGMFRKKEDLLKIYGMDSAWFEQAKAWISIQARTQKQKPTTFTKKPPVINEIIDINVADSIQLVEVKGIGPALSRRIRNFRDRLGGFISLDQLKEVYGLDSLIVPELKKRFVINENFQPRRINLNTVTLSEFKHPYLKQKEAQAILSFRTQHGLFQSLDQLSSIKILNPASREKLRPYLIVE